MLVTKEALLAVRRSQEHKIELSTPGEDGKPRHVMVRKLNAREMMAMQETVVHVTKTAETGDQVYLRSAACLVLFALIDANGDRMFDPNKDSNVFAQVGEMSTDDIEDINREYIKHFQPKTQEQRIAEATEKAKNSDETESEGLESNSNGSVSPESSTALTPTS